MEQKQNNNMLDEQNAKKIVDSIFSSGFNTNRTFYEMAYNSAMRMSKWKEEQIIAKACEWLEKHVEDFMPPTCSLHDYNTGELIHFFKKAMKE